MSLAEALGSKKCFKMSLAEALGARNASRSKKIIQEMLQDVSGRGTWSKTCFKMSLAEALGARNAARRLWQRHLEQEMLQDVSDKTPLPE